MPDHRGLDLQQLKALIDKGLPGLDLPTPHERKALRIRLGLTQAEMAAALGVHPETLGRWERGDGGPGREAAREYGQALEILRHGRP